MILAKQKNGFTLVETLVAIGVLTMALAGPLFLVQQSFMSAYFAKDQMIATALAQEGIEYVRAVRDGNYLSGRSWLSTISACTGGKCTVDTVNNSLAACVGACSPLNFNKNTKDYNQAVTTSINSPTPFTRTITVTNISSNEIRVDSDVSWTDRNVNRNVTLSEFLMDWQ